MIRLLSQHQKNMVVKTRAATINENCLPQNLPNCALFISLCTPKKNKKSTASSPNGTFLQQTWACRLYINAGNVVFFELWKLSIEKFKCINITSINKHKRVRGSRKFSRTSQLKSACNCYCSPQQIAVPIKKPGSRFSALPIKKKKSTWKIPHLDGNC